jgi:hypothetical protein
MKKTKQLIFITLLILTLIVSTFSIIPTHATTIFSSGWENSGGTDVTDGGAWTGTVGSPTVQGTTVNSGSYAMNVTDATRVYKTITAEDEAWYNSTIYLGAKTEDWRVFYQLYSVTNAVNIITVMFNKFNTFKIWYYSGSSSTNVQDLATTMNTGTWYNLGLHYKVDASEGSIDLYLNDVAIWNSGNLDTSYQGNVERFYVGDTGDMNADFYYVDDVSITDMEAGGEATYITGSITDLTYSFNQTKQGTVASFKTNWATDGTLSHYWYSTDFADGTNFVNETASEFSDTWANTTLTLPASIDEFNVICYANTTNGLENATATITFNTTENFIHYMEDFTVALAQIAVDLVEANDVNGSVYFPECYARWNIGNTLPRLNVTTNIGLFGAPTTRNETGDVQEWRTIFYIDEYIDTGAPDNQAPLIYYTFNNTSPYNTFRVSDIKMIGYRYFNETDREMFTGISVYMPYAEYSATTGVTDFRVDHCCFQDLCGSGLWVFGGDGYQIQRVVSGLIDHCVLNNTVGNPGFMSELDNRTLGYGIALRRWWCDVWEEDATDVWGQYNNYTVVIEDNYFSKWRHGVMTNDGIHQITRFNTFTGCYGIAEVDGHGSFGSEGYEGVGTRCIEVYNNTFSYPDNTWSVIQSFEMWAVNIRGGSALVYNNTVIGGGEDYDLLDLNNDYGNYAPICPQCFINQTYIWDNSGYDELIHYVADSVENVNYFLNAPTGYTPYTYPHPLAGIEEGETTYYYLTVNSATGGWTDLGVGTFQYLNGETAEIEATPESGYSFTSWTVNGGSGGSTNPLELTMSENKTVTPTFTLYTGWGSWWGYWWVVGGILSAVILYLKKKGIKNEHVARIVTMIIEDGLFRIIPIWILNNFIPLYIILPISIIIDSIVHIISNKENIKNRVCASTIYNSLFYVVFYIVSLLTSPYVGFVAGILVHVIIDYAQYYRQKL